MEPIDPSVAAEMIFNLSAYSTTVVLNSVGGNIDKASQVFSDLFFLNIKNLADFYRKQGIEDFEKKAFVSIVDTIRGELGLKESNQTIQ